jgi:predicted ABC-type ATPase
LSSAAKLLPDQLHCLEFVNADSIAAGLSPFRPDSVALQAGRLMLNRIHALASEGRDFAFETTMAARSFAPFLRRCRGEGYAIHLVFLWLSSPELALKRVASRVKQGGHDVPESVVRRRYDSGIRNLFELYMPLADSWVVYDNSDVEPKRIAHQDDDGRPEIKDIDKWHAIQEMRR